MYIKKTCHIRDRMEVEKHYSGRYGAPGMSREPKRRKTPEEMAKQNHWRKYRELRRTMELNFGPGDWHVTLTCKKELRPSVEEAVQVIRLFRDNLRKEYKKRGWELKYIITCEVGERGAVHWHMIVNDKHDKENSTAELIRKHWTRGRAYFSPMDDTGEYQQLAEYIVKETSQRIEAGQTAEKLSYMISRNMIRPVVQEEKVRANGWKMEPVPPKGWKLVPESLVNGFNPFTGRPYQYYTLRKEGGIDADGRNLHRYRHKGS